MEHLRLPLVIENIPRKKHGGGGNKVINRNKVDFTQKQINNIDNIKKSHSELKSRFNGIINPSLIFEIDINQNVDIESFEKSLSSMDIQILSIESKKGFWIAFTNNESFDEFKRKLKIYGNENSFKYFDNIENIHDIPIEKKIGKSLRETPLNDKPDFIDIELWKMLNPEKNEKFVSELKEYYKNNSNFRITDELVTYSFVLLRVKLNKEIFDEIIEFKEIARADRPSVIEFNPYKNIRPDINDLKIEPPSEDSTGILIIDSGIISNHPLLEKCVGGEEDFQSEEKDNHDTVGHGTAIAGSTVYGDIEGCLDNKTFYPSNWIFSAKVMYSEKNDITNQIKPTYDPEKLIEHQFRDAVVSFLDNYEYKIKVVNISLGNSNEIWKKDYNRQLPLATIIDELAYTYKDVVFIISAGNYSPLECYNSIEEIKDNYPKFLLENDNFNIINPATSALAITVGSISDDIRTQQDRYGKEQLKINIANKNEPSPFTRTGPGINGMIKPELVEYGGNLILFNNYNRIQEDDGGKLLLLTNQSTDRIMKYDYGTSFSAAKVSHTAGLIANHFPDKSSNFIKNMLLVGAKYPSILDHKFYYLEKKDKAEKINLNVCGYGLSEFERAINSYTNRVVLWDENFIKLDNVKIYSINIPEVLFREKGRKKLTVVLTYNPETRSTRGDSYIGNQLSFYLYHTKTPEEIISKKGKVEDIYEDLELEKYKIPLIPGINTLKAGCHQKAWKEYDNRHKNIPNKVLSLVLINSNKWKTDENSIQDYCISLTIEHEKEIEIYNEIKTRVRIR